MPRRHDDDDDDYRPRRRSRYDDDEDDDLPRRSRRLPADARPRRARSSGSSNGVVILLIALFVGVVVAGVVGGGLYLLHRAEKKRDAFVARIEADIAKEEARHKQELAQAAQDVKAAEAGGGLRVSAVQFAKAYQGDEDRADQWYKNKVLDVTGAVDELDFTGETYTVHLKAGPEDTVNCEFAKDPNVRARLAGLRPGDTVTIRGKCLGGGASIEACVLVE
jgi:hypothetical protein